MLNLIIFATLLSRRFFNIIFFIFFCSRLTAQNGVTGNSDWQIKPVINSGFILVHRISIGHLVKGYPTIFELNISKPTLGNKLWQLENNKPDIGITLQLMDYKNPRQLGYAYTVAPYIEIPLNVKEKKSRVIFRLCWGLTYITKSFDIHTDPKNIAIGSHFNAFAQFKWFWHLQLTRNIRFEPGFSLSHASNGKAKNPNLGLNVVSLNAGFNFLIPSRSKPDITKIDSSTKVRSKNELITFAAFGFNERNVATEELKTFVFSVAYQRNVRNTHKFSLGMDVFYDENYFTDYKKSFSVQPTGFDKLRICARAGYSYNVGRVSFPIEIGYYVFQRTDPDGVLISRMGVRYYTPGGIMVHFGLRTHIAVAYTLEYGLGYRFFFK